MKKNVLRPTLVAMLVLIGMSGMAAAMQEHDHASHASQAGGMYYVQIEHVKPSMQKEYEAAAKAMVKAFAEAKIDMPFHTVSGPEMGYVYAMHVGDFAGMDDLMKTYGEAVGTIGHDRWAQLTAKSSKLIDSTESLLTMHRPDLSYTPEKPGLMQEEIRYFNYRFYYTTPGMEGQLESVIQQFTSMYARKGVDVGWQVYQSVTGSDLPLYVVVEPARSPADYAARVESLRGELGEEAMRLTEQATACLRKLERRGGWNRPDLSYMIEKH